jgi:hypothetical protein
MGLGGEATFAPGGRAFAVGANALADMAGVELLATHQAAPFLLDRRLIRLWFLIVASGRHKLPPGSISLTDAGPVERHGSGRTALLCGPPVISRRNVPPIHPLHKM